MLWLRSRPADLRSARGLAGRIAPSVTPIWLLAAAALALLVIFDLSPPLPFNDDWMYAWSVRQLAGGHGLRLFPESTAMAIVQVFWGTVFTLGHPDVRLLRLSLVPAVAVTAWCSYRLARRLGADPFWGAVAACTLLTMPLAMANATSFMSETLYIALVMAIAVAALEWLTRGRWRWLCVGLLVLAPLQRQLGLAMIPAVTVVLIAARRRSLNRGDFMALVASWVFPPSVALAASRVAMSQALYPAPDLARLDVGHALFPLMPMLGLGLIPFTAALAFRPREVGESPWSITAAALAVVGAAGCLVDLARFGMVFPGNVLSPLGFAAILGGDKPPVFPGAVFRALEIASVTSFVVALVMRRRAWAPPRLQPEGALLLVIGAAQFVPLLAVSWFVYDRYYLPVLAPLVPLVAGVASRGLRQRVARAWAAAALVSGLILYGVGEQDYLAWQSARDRAAQLAYQQAPADQVQAGFEANAVYVELPRYERTGMADLFAILGPEQPQIVLRYAGSSDPRPGVGYWSLASGRIVISR
jgi:Dolichyl-phosphate-mannose-protein mannosyltransferase